MFRSPQFPLWYYIPQDIQRLILSYSIETDSEWWTVKSISKHRRVSKGFRELIDDLAFWRLFFPKLTEVPRCSDYFQIIKRPKLNETVYGWYKYLVTPTKIYDLNTCLREYDVIEIHGEYLFCSELNTLSVYRRSLKNLVYQDTLYTVRLERNLVRVKTPQREVVFPIAWEAHHGPETMYNLVTGVKGYAHLGIKIYDDYQGVSNGYC